MDPIHKFSSQITQLREFGTGNNCGACFVNLEIGGKPGKIIIIPGRFLLNGQVIMFGRSTSNLNAR